MKTLIATTALALATLTGAAQAQGSISTAEMQQIENFLPGVDASALTYAEAQTALNVIASSDSRGEAQGKLRAILR
ncbi:hypothetical protein [Ponticoccus alexandrii]|uniref:Uncharacterized protein n=1 Tax=Ponticoccus alexandrii TaxID=1943633 RepID=A0ABX7F5M7_9RHOB|nr:hypothetical protein [Ponticoccus alexandrii]ETA52355.1 hypothetical protein P279_09085 [Rhodobacteraceae bacterium PD-2]QRF65835.1 hypothetical protein GQA70_05620 [Ponticoccus alexandrii]